MSNPGIGKIASILIAFASASLFSVADPAHAETALFRAKRTWWFSHTGSWTDGYVIPPTGSKSYQPPASARVGSIGPAPSFTAPNSFIKNTTYHFACDFTGCGIYYPPSSGWYSYWNAKGSFRAQNPNAPTTTTTIRFATTMSNPSKAPTAMGEPVTPTTTWGGRYDHSRGGSIMIWPGSNRFGGTMRFLYGPNHRYYQLVTTYGPFTSVTFPPRPLSQQLGTGVEILIGEVELYSQGFGYRLTDPVHIDRLIVGTTSMGGPEYYVKKINYLVTRAPYTTGMVQAWEPNGNTNTIQTATGYDNRTSAGLNGNISLVQPRLVHAYTVFPPSSGKPIQLTWSSARMRKIDFRFLPEPAGAAMLVLGLGILACLYRLRTRRSERMTIRANPR